MKISELVNTYNLTDEQFDGLKNAVEKHIEITGLEEFEICIQENGTYVICSPNFRPNLQGEK